MITKYQEEIAIQKDLLSHMPINNIKNTNNKIDKILEIENKYKKDFSNLHSEIETRYNKYIAFKKNSDLIKVEEEKQKLFDSLLILDEKSSYFKSNLGQLIYTLERFYDNNLNELNDLIEKILNIFKTININLTVNDFNYTYYTFLYMNQYLLNKDLENLKNCFEDIYFKAPTLFKQISLNFKYLYYKNKKKFDNYYNTILNEILLNNSKKNIFEEYFLLNDKYFDLKINNQELTLNKFINKEYIIKDYQPEAMLKTYQFFGNFTLDDSSKLEDILKKLLKSLQEYRGYLKYQLLIDEFRKLFQDKDKNKGVAITKYKELTKKENSLIKLNSKLNSVFIKNNKLKRENIINQMLILSDELEKLYFEYENDIFLENISKLGDNTTLFEVLNIYLGNYLYLVRLIKEKYKDLSNSEIDEFIDNLNKFVKNTRFTMLNHVCINDTKDLKLVILDKFKILGLNLTEDNLADNNLENLINNIMLVINYEYISKNINLDNISFIVECNNLNIFDEK